VRRLPPQLQATHCPWPQQHSHARAPVVARPQLERLLKGSDGRVVAPVEVVQHAQRQLKLAVLRVRPARALKHAAGVAQRLAAVRRRAGCCCCVTVRRVRLQPAPQEAQRLARVQLIRVAHAQRQQHLQAVGVGTQRPVQRRDGLAVACSEGAGGGSATACQCVSCVCPTTCVGPLTAACVRPAPPGAGSAATQQARQHTHLAVVIVLCMHCAQQAPRRGVVRVLLHLQAAHTAPGHPPASARSAAGAAAMAATEPHARSRAHNGSATPRTQRHTTQQPAAHLCLQRQHCFTQQAPLEQVLALLQGSRVPKEGVGLCKHVLARRGRRCARARLRVGGVGVGAG
jgi:hypothetical protein